MWRTWLNTPPLTAFDQLLALFALHQGDAAAALRQYTGLPTSALAERLGVSRQTLGQCLNLAPGRTYPHVRRALEAELQLQPEDLDRLLATAAPTLAKDT